MSKSDSTPERMKLEVDLPASATPALRTMLARLAFDRKIDVTVSDLSLYEENQQTSSPSYNPDRIVWKINPGEEKQTAVISYGLFAKYVKSQGRSEVVAENFFLGLKNRAESAPEEAVHTYLYYDDQGYFDGIRADQAASLYLALSNGVVYAPGVPVRTTEIFGNYVRDLYQGNPGHEQA
jgi:hypothetical protein